MKVNIHIFFKTMLLKFTDQNLKKKKIQWIKVTIHTPTIIITIIIIIIIIIIIWTHYFNTSLAMRMEW